METLSKDLTTALEDSMLRIIQVMRHILTNQQEEYNALIIRQPLIIESILNKRQQILNDLKIKQKIMSNILKEINEDQKVTEHFDLEDLELLVGKDNISILLLRDQIMALAAGIETFNYDNHSTLLKQVATQPQLKRQALAVLDLDDA